MTKPGLWQVWHREWSFQTWECLHDPWACVGGRVCQGMKSHFSPRRTCIGHYTQRPVLDHSKDLPRRSLDEPGRPPRRLTNGPHHLTLRASFAVGWGGKRSLSSPSTYRRSVVLGWQHGRVLDAAWKPTSGLIRGALADGKTIATFCGGRQHKPNLECVGSRHKTLIPLRISALLIRPYQ